MPLTEVLNRYLGDVASDAFLLLQAHWHTGSSRALLARLASATHIIVHDAEKGDRYYLRTADEVREALSGWPGGNPTAIARARAPSVVATSTLARPNSWR